MAGGQVSVETRDAGKKYCYISISGALDAYSFSKFEETLANLYEGGHRLFVIDCKELAYISSSGIGTLMGFAKRLRDNNGDVALIRLSAKIYGIMNLLGFTAIFKIFSNEEEAAASFLPHKGK